MTYNLTLKKRKSGTQISKDGLVFESACVLIAAYAVDLTT